MQELRSRLGRYIEGDETLRSCLVTATPEHLFEQKEIREFFSDWKQHPVLAVAHKEASEWYLGGGRSSLGNPRERSKT